jgi:uncharacterized protein YndB with AHSA1/START domain
MPALTVTRTIPAPRVAVFDLISDHAGYARFRGIRRAELLRHGKPPPNGVGAIRQVLIGPLRFDEEIIIFERPSRMDYLIFEVNAPFEHNGGTMRLSEESDGTRVEWTTEFQIPVRVLGRVQEWIWALALRRGFRRVLQDVERMLTGPNPGPQGPAS